MIKKLLFPIVLIFVVVVGGVAADFLRNKGAASASDAHAETVDGHGKAAKDDGHGKKKKKKDSHGKASKDDGHGKKAKDDGHGKKKKKKKKKGGHGEEADDGHGGASSSSSAIVYLKFKRQFVVPVVKNGKTQSLVLLNLNLELTDEAPDDVHSFEPKLRDALMRGLLQLSHEGTFSNDLTNPETYDHIQTTLLAATTTVLLGGVENVLILDLSKQDQ
ncbi:MAG: hypothetical protein COA43_11930 [Robiginitomaculum sp.]|nr:MAG: hypothetical protein COA43_11930 [Robiginitomaculum sp.]